MGQDWNTSSTNRQRGNTFISREEDTSQGVDANGVFHRPTTLLTSLSHNLPDVPAEEAKALALLDVANLHITIVMPKHPRQGIHLLQSTFHLCLPTTLARDSPLKEY